jgi:hypothetical protein
MQRNKYYNNNCRASHFENSGQALGLLNKAGLPPKADPPLAEKPCPTVLNDEKFIALSS